MAEETAYLDLIFALQHLRIRYRPSLLGKPGSFNRDVALVQGERVVPPAREIDVEALLANYSGDPLAVDPMWEMLGKRACAEWPEAASLAVRGIMAFGPGDAKTATSCARGALALDGTCLLARQLLSLIQAPFDPRVPFGAPPSAWPDLPTRLEKRD